MQKFTRFALLASARPGRGCSSAPTSDTCQSVAILMNRRHSCGANLPCCKSMIAIRRTQVLFSKLWKSQKSRFSQRWSLCHSILWEIPCLNGSPMLCVLRTWPCSRSNFTWKWKEVYEELWLPKRLCPCSPSAWTSPMRASPLIIHPLIHHR